MSKILVSRQNNNEKTKMNSIEEIIGRLCPEGVKMVKLGEIGTFTRGNGLQKKDFTETGVPCIHYGQIYTHYGTFATETISKCSPELAKSLRKAKKGDLIIATTSENVEDVCKAVAWLGDYDVVVSSDAFIFSHGQNPKYIAYLFQTQDFFRYKQRKCNGTKVMRLSGESLADYTIPLPPLEVQRAIADVLDKFSALEAELEAELDCRKRQYEYYRERLLNFEQLPPPEREKIKFVRLGEVGKFYGGLTGKSKYDFINGNARYLSYVNVFSNTSIPNQITDFVKIEDGEKQNSIEYGDIIFTGSSETANEAGMTCVITRKPTEKLYLNSFCFGFRFFDLSLYNLTFLKHLLRSRGIRKDIIKSASGVTRFNISKQRLASLTIPLPPLEEQKRIAEILDRFERLTSDLGEGLPAEIAERRRQYEHYRERLLSFGAAE